MRILVVEDEKKVASFIERALAAERYVVDAVHDGKTGLARLKEGRYDLAVLDVMLPGRDGLAVLRDARAAGLKLPILLLTARDAIADKVAGFDHGADDYLTKPFDVAELLARVRALLRRGTAAQPSVLRLGDLSLDVATREVRRGDRKIELTAREHALLEFLLRHPGRVLSRALIAQHVWGVDFDTMTNVIDVYVRYLREKIDADFEPKLLHTVRGVGYVLRAPEP